MSKKPKSTELPLLLPGMIAIVSNPNDLNYMYCGIVQRITDGKARVLFEGFMILPIQTSDISPSPYPQHGQISLHYGRNLHHGLITTTKLPNQLLTMCKGFEESVTSPCP
ncbi:hypothetical protein PIB30_078792 [Stylosanthes scabra]|uniref:Uncharacterized protein n=1 Tax=Stylosanthes scabra TaxID=79078 RepID=A0ABU6XPB1_9FABA|nr:hypothetical protein [Stylosanthes scabra]